MKARIDHYLRLAFGHTESRVYHVVNDILAIIIVIAVILVIFESIEGVYLRYAKIFNISEIIIVSVFTLEYITYIYLAPKKKKYLFSAFGIIDLLAILPAYLGFIFLPFANFRVLRVLRIVRVLRLLRLLRLLKLLSYTKRRHPGERITFKEFPWYTMEIYFFALLSVVVIAGTFMYLAEQNVAGSLFTNIPQSMWWAIVTLTTVGYGDMIPQTILGRIIAALTMVSGLMLFALLISVVGKIMKKMLFGSPDEITAKE